MRYQYKGNESIHAELARIAKAKEAAREERRERRILLMNLRREQKRLEEIQADTKVLDDEIRHLTAQVPQLPPPIYGGPAGLRAAAEEIAQHELRKRQAAA